MKRKVNDLNCQDNDENSENDEKAIRLQTFLAHAGIASRRACETIIADARVSVNGSIVTEMGVKVLPSDIIYVDGKPVQTEEAMRYVLLNKPSGYVCSLADEKNRPVAADLLKPHFQERLYNVGRLDMFSSGLIIFTNDGAFAAKVSHPSAAIEKEYIIETSLPFPPDLPEKFTKGLRIDNIFYKAREAERLNSRRMRVVLVEGKNREIRRVIESFDVRVKSLCRVRIGSIAIAPLQGGQWRELTLAERKSLLSSGEMMNITN